MVLEADEQGRPIATIPFRAGVYVPDAGVRVFPDSEGRYGLIFPDGPDLAGLVAPTFPWPGWHRIDVDAADALRRFVSLADAADALAFARRYGPLWACTVHPYPCLWRGHTMAPADSKHPCAWENAEPLDWWLGLAGTLRAVVTSIARLRQGESLRREDWLGMGWLAPDEPLGSPIAEGLFVSARVNGELTRYGVGLALSDDLRPEVNTGLGFLPALWLQIVAITGDGRTIAACSACGYPYVRRGRAPKAGQRNYCPDCHQHGARQRLWRSASNERER